MKRLIILNTKRIFLAMGFLLLVLNGYSQDKKPTREERKQIRQAQLLSNFTVIDSLFEKRAFVLEADYLEGRYGDQAQVSSLLNFIMVNYDYGVLQTGNNVAMGYNGVGGVTAEGTVGKWELSKNFRNLSFTVRFNIHSDIGIYDVFLTVDADNHARATITGLWPGKLTYNGHLNALGNSRIFKGTRTI